VDKREIRKALLAPDSPAGFTACVTALLREGPVGPEILLIVRREHDGDPWSGQVALPGGKAHAGEKAQEAAAREVWEEVGLDLRKCASVLGCLPTRAPANRPEMAVVPFVAVMEQPLTPPYLGEEIAAAVWAPLPALLGNAATARRRIRDQERSFPAFAYRELLVWGLTYQILLELAAVLDMPYAKPSIDSK